MSAVIMLAAVAAIYAAVATVETTLDDTQVALSTAAVSASDGTLFPADPVFGPKGPVFSPNPAFVGGMRLLLPLVGGDPVRLLHLLVGPLVLIYLLGMYTLLWRQCRSWSIAVFVAILSTVIVDAMGGAAWGTGTLSATGPSGLPLAATPWMVLGLLDAIHRRPGRWRLVGVFLLAGLMGHFDLGWTLNITTVLTATYLVERRFAPAAWLAMALCLALTAATALPPLAQAVRNRLIQPLDAAAVQMLCQVLREGEEAMLLPQALRALPDWLVWAVPLALPTIIMLSQVDHHRVPFLRFWIAFAVAAAVVAVAGQAISQGIGLAMHRPPPVLSFVRAWVLLMVPLYALFAQAVTGLFRLTVGHHGLIRMACALAAAAWMIPSDNLAPARHLAYAGASGLLREEHHLRRFRRVEESAARRAESEAIARWAAAETPTDAVFLVEDRAFRLLSRRTIVAGDGDGSYLWSAQTQHLADWQQRLARQAQLMRPAGGKADPAAIGRFVSELSERPSFALGSQWYAVLPTLAAPEGSAMLTEIPSDDWGRFYRLYRIR